MKVLLRPLTLGIAIMAIFGSTGAHAECVCRCVDGEVRQLCQSTMDLPALCAPQLCPLVPPSIPPIKALTLPPLGTSECRQVQVFNLRTGQYEWQRVCR